MKRRVAPWTNQAGAGPAVAVADGGPSTGRPAVRPGSCGFPPPSTRLSIQATTPSSSSSPPDRVVHSDTTWSTRTLGALALRSRWRACPAAAATAANPTTTSATLASIMRPRMAAKSEPAPARRCQGRARAHPPTRPPACPLAHPPRLPPPARPDGRVDVPRKRVKNLMPSRGRRPRTSTPFSLALTPHPPPSRARIRQTRRARGCGNQPAVTLRRREEVGEGGSDAREQRHLKGGWNAEGGGGGARDEPHIPVRGQRGGIPAARGRRTLSARRQSSPVAAGRRRRPLPPPLSSAATAAQHAGGL